jgi:predicted acyl esterase
VSLRRFVAILTSAAVVVVAQGVQTAVGAAGGGTLACDVKITMRDGSRLSANVSRPSRPGRFPTLLTTTPYGKDGGIGATGEGVGGAPPPPGSCPEPGTADTLGAAAAGYAVVTVDWRGTGRSDAGDWYTREWITDSEDILDWIQRQQWSNGRVGATGCSNLGGSTIVLASADQLRVQQGKRRAIYAAWADSFFPDVYRASVGTGGASMTPAAFAIAGLLDASWAYGDPTQALTTPGASAPVQPFQPVLSKQYEINQGTSSYDAYWQSIDTMPMASQLDIPLGMTAAIDDLWQLGMMPFQYAQHTTRSPHPSFFLSPGGHCAQGGWDALTYGSRKSGSKRALVMAWFDHWLKGARNGIDKLPNFNIFPTGAKGWTVQSAAMPTPGTTLVDYYLDNVAAGSVADVGSLRTQLPRADGTDQVSCIVCGMAPVGMPTDSAALRYETPPFTRDVTLAGNASARIWANFDRPDGAISLNLLDVAADGTATHVVDAQIRARDRAVDPKRSIYTKDGRLLDAFHPLTVEAREPVDGLAPYDLTFTPLAAAIAKGHHLELRVAFTDPKYVLPAPLLASMAGENMHVVHGGLRASRITLSFITGRTTEPRQRYDRGSGS